MHGFDRDDLQAPLAEINTTPLVDVMLVLLVIFLVTAPMLSNSIKLQLPTESATPAQEQKALTLSINDAGQYYLDDQPVSEMELEQKFISAHALNPKQPLHIRADKAVTYSALSHALALAGRLGLTNIGFITEPNQ